MESTYPLCSVAVCTVTIHVTPQQSVMKLAGEVNHWTTGKSTIAMDGFRCQFTHPWNRKRCSLPSFYGFLLELQQNILVKPCDGVLLLSEKWSACTSTSAKTSLPSTCSCRSIHNCAIWGGSPATFVLLWWFWCPLGFYGIFYALDDQK